MAGFPSLFVSLLGLLLSCLVGTIGAFNTSLSYGIPLDLQDAFLSARSLPAGLQLKLLCLGDSITVGFGDGNPNLQNLNNGYRLDLFNILSNAGISSQFIGSQTSGTNNPQPKHEGYGGALINFISGQLKAGGALSQQPNVVLIHAGTNDNDYENPDDPTTFHSGTAARLGDMIDYVLCHAPNAVVLVAQVIQNKNFYGTAQATTNQFNAAIPGLVADRYKRGFKIRVVDMSMIGGDQLGDTLHPRAPAYQEMAYRWYSAILGIPDSWWSTTSSAGAGVPIEVCARDTVTFTPLLNGNVVAPGFHANGDVAAPPSQAPSSGYEYVPHWTDKDYIASGTGLPGSGVIFADIDGDGRPDYLWANYTQGSEGSLNGWLNGGQYRFTALNDGNPFTFGWPGASYVELADLNGDKKADLIIIANGQFKIWQNLGLDGKIIKFQNLPNLENGLNYIFQYTAPFHYFADITGDGRADLIVQNPNQVLDLYINEAFNADGSITWKQCKSIGIASGLLRFVDIDGDGKADYVSMDSDSGLSGFFNNYTSGCDLTWQPINKGGPKSLEYGIPASPGQVRLVDWTGDGKADYLVVSDDIGTVRLWENDGYVRPAQSTLGGWAAAVRLADVNGDGTDDYISVVENNGGIAAWLNGGQAGSTWVWNQQYNGYVIALGYQGATRKQVHLADINGDGYEDYVVVDEYGALHCYLNFGLGSNGLWNFKILGPISIGVGMGDRVRIADFNGDGKADIIFLDDTGAAKVWLQTGNGDTSQTWTIINGGYVAAVGVGANPADVQFADIDGDGKADYCWLHPDTGALDVWYNLWDGKTVGWFHQTSFPGQGVPGQNIMLGRVAASGRNDYVAIAEDGSLRVWANQCSVIGTTTRVIAGCGKPPLATQAAPEQFNPSPRAISTNAGGQTVLQELNGGQVTLPLGIATPTTITTDGTVFTFIPGGNTQVTTITNQQGQVIIEGSLGQLTTLPPGVNGPVTITQAGGEVVTYNPSPGAPAAPATVVTTVQGGTTVLSGSQQAVTIPTGLTAPITTTAGGVVFTFSPSPAATTTTTTLVGAPPFPVASNGLCQGPDCVNGSCRGILCVSLGCSGSDCNYSTGRCQGLNCIALGCIGSSCSNGVCSGSGCSNSGCRGSNCNGSGSCFGLGCISLGCFGLGCNSNTNTCTGSNCSTRSCTGSNCNNGRCTGSGCSSQGTQNGGDPPVDDNPPDDPGNNPTQDPGNNNNNNPTQNPGNNNNPTQDPGNNNNPTQNPGNNPTQNPGNNPTQDPGNNPTTPPTITATTAPSTCTSTTTITNCRVNCAITNFGDTSTTTACTSTTCSTTTTCATAARPGTTTTSTSLTGVCTGPRPTYSTWSPRDPDAPPPVLGSDNRFTSASPAVTSPARTTIQTQATSLSDLPTLPAQSYCTQTQCNGKQVLVPKTADSCPDFQPACTTTTASPTTISPVATPTHDSARPDDPQGQFNCWRTGNEFGYSTFTLADYKQVTATFCDANYVLPPSSGAGAEIGSLYNTSSYYVGALISWAKDQTGCGAKDYFYPSSDYNTCRNAFLGPFQTCQIDPKAQTVDSTLSAGGYYVYNTHGIGCVLFELYAAPLNTVPKQTSRKRSIYGQVDSNVKANSTGSFVPPPGHYEGGWWISDNKTAIPPS